MAGVTSVSTGPKHSPPALPSQDPLTLTFELVLQSRTRLGAIAVHISLSTIQTNSTPLLRAPTTNASVEPTATTMCVLLARTAIQALGEAALLVFIALPAREAGRGGATGLGVACAASGAQHCLGSTIVGAEGLVVRAGSCVETYGDGWAGEGECSGGAGKCVRSDITVEERRGSASASATYLKT